MISPWLFFGQNFEISLPCVFWGKFQKKVFGDILDRKIAFLRYKNIQDFGQEFENFPSFLFMLKRRIKSVW